jgi:transcriptional regulator
MLTAKQLEIINGSLLGDGTIWTNFIDPMCKFQLSQSKLDKDGINKKSYFSWWAEEFIDIGCSIRPRTIQPKGILYANKIYHSYVFTTKCNYFWTELEKKWYKPIVHPRLKRKKIIPNDLKLTPLTTCIWIMEDGSNYAKGGNLTIETQGFSPSEVDFLIHRLYEDLSIKATKKRTKKNDQYRIFVGVKYQKNLIEIIKPYVAWECFKYKLDNSYNKVHQSGQNHSQAKITDLQAKEMIDLRREGKPLSEIAKNFNISKANVSLITSGARWKHLESHVEVIKKPRLTKEQKTKIIDLHKKGLLQKEIAKMTNTNQSSISRLLVSIKNASNK